MGKKRVLTNYNKLSDDVRDMLHMQYPNGILQGATLVKNHKNEFFHAVTVEIDEVVYMVKIAMEEPKEKKQINPGGFPFDEFMDEFKDSVANDPDPFSLFEDE